MFAAKEGLEPEIFKAEHILEETSSALEFKTESNSKEKEKETRKYAS